MKTITEIMGGTQVFQNITQDKRIKILSFSFWAHFGPLTAQNRAFRLNKVLADFPSAKTLYRCNPLRVFRHSKHAMRTFIHKIFTLRVRPPFGVRSSLGSDLPRDQTLREARHSLGSDLPRSQAFPGVRPPLGARTFAGSGIPWGQTSLGARTFAGSNLLC
jgi:hypothetical protein